MLFSISDRCKFYRIVTVQTRNSEYLLLYCQLVILLKPSSPPIIILYITYLGVLYEENPSTSDQGQISTERQNDLLLQWKQPTGDRVTI